MESKVTDMYRLAFEGQAKDEEQKLKALNNLLVLARESESGAIRVWNEVRTLYRKIGRYSTFQGKIVPILLKIASNASESSEVSVTAIRILDETLKNHGRVGFCTYI